MFKTLNITANNYYSTQSIILKEINYNFVTKLEYVSAIVLKLNILTTTWQINIQVKILLDNEI